MKTETNLTLLSIYWSTAVLMLLWTIYLDIIIFYGKSKVNKLTSRPFFIAGIKFLNMTILASTLFFLSL